VQKKNDLMRPASGGPCDGESQKKSKRRLRGVSVHAGRGEQRLLEKRPEEGKCIFAGVARRQQSADTDEQCGAPARTASKRSARNANFSAGQAQGSAATTSGIFGEWGASSLPQERPKGPLGIRLGNSTEEKKKKSVLGTRRLQNQRYLRHRRSSSRGLDATSPSENLREGKNLVPPLTADPAKLGAEKKLQLRRLPSARDADDIPAKAGKNEVLSLRTSLEPGKGEEMRGAPLSMLEGGEVCEKKKGALHVEKGRPRRKGGQGRSRSSRVGHRDLPSRRKEGVLAREEKQSLFARSD